MTYTDFIPESDSEFHTFQGNLILKVEDNVVTWGIPPEAVTRLKSFQAPWIVAYEKASNADFRTTPITRTKNEARYAFEKEIRAFNNEFLASNRKVTNGDREAMKLTIRSTVRVPVAAPTTVPIGKIDRSLNYRHTIRITDSATGSKAKPRGVFGCEVWIKIGTEVPNGPPDYEFYSTDTRSPLQVDFTAADKGKTAYYLLRWVNKRGEVGTWADPISAMIIA